MTTPVQDSQASAAAQLAKLFTGAGASQDDATAAAEHYLAAARQMITSGDFTLPAEPGTTAPSPRGAAPWDPALHPRGQGGQFGQGSTAPAPTNAKPVGNGASGPQVAQLQERLNQLGAKPPLTVDGKFGSLTLAAVRQYQETHLDAHGKPLKVDGLVGPLTTGALRQAKQATTGKAGGKKTSGRKSAITSQAIKQGKTRTGSKTGKTSSTRTSRTSTSGGGGVAAADQPGSITPAQRRAVTAEMQIRQIPPAAQQAFGRDMPILSRNDSTALLAYIRNTYPFKTTASAGPDAAFRPELHPRFEKGTPGGGRFRSLEEGGGGRHTGPGSFEHIRSIEHLADEIDTGHRMGGAGQTETAAALRNVARHVGLRQVGVAKVHMSAALAAARREKIGPAQRRDLKAIASSLDRIPAGTYPEPGFGERAEGDLAPPSLQRHRRTGPGYFPGRVHQAGGDPVTSAAAPKYYTDKAGKKYPVPPRPKPGTPPTPAQQQADRDEYARQLTDQIAQVRAQLDGQDSDVPRELLQAMLDHLTAQLAAIKQARPAKTAASAPLSPGEAAAAAITDLGLTAAAADLALEIAEWNYFANGGTIEAAESAGWQRNKGNASHLHDYWARGEGAAKIRWGTSGDWYRCRDLLRKYIADPEGYCERMHKEVTGMTTSQHAEEDRGGKKASGAYARAAAALEAAFKVSELRNRLGEWTGGQGGHGGGQGGGEHEKYARAFTQLAADIGETRKQLPASHPAADYLRDAQFSAGKEARRPGRGGLEDHAAAAEGNLIIAQHRHQSLPGGTPATAARIEQHLAAIGALRDQRARLFPVTTPPPGPADHRRLAAADDPPAGLPQLVTIPGVDILAAGTWRLSTGRQTFTQADLQAAIDASTCPAVGPPVIKIGHLDPRFAPQPDHDGEPALGRVSNLRLSPNGAKIVGDLAGMPGWLGAIAASAFPKRSVEGKYGFRCQIGHQHSFVLTGLALLGITPPGVGVLSGLPDVASLYGLTAAASAQQGRAWRTEQDQEGQVMAVTEEDVRRQYYATAGAPQTWWITELQMDPPALIVADQDTGKIFRVGYRIDGSAVSFTQPAEVASYADVAAARGTGPVVAYATAAASRAVTGAGGGPGGWDAAAQVAALGDDPSPAQLKAMFALPADTKSGSKLPHHVVSGGKVGAPNPVACSAAISALNGGRGGMTGVSASQARTAYTHLAAHLRAMGRTPPDFSGSGDGDGEDWATTGEGPPGTVTGGAEPGTHQGPGSFNEDGLAHLAGAYPGQDIRAQASDDADADDTAQGLVASLDATLDEGARLAGTVNAQQLPEAAGQVMSLVVAAETIADQLMGKLGIYDPDDTGTDADDDSGTDETTENLVAGLDATLDQAVALAGTVDRKQLPADAAQVLDLAVASRAIVDQLMDTLGIYDPDDADSSGSGTRAAASDPDGDGDDDSTPGGDTDQDTFPGVSHGSFTGSHSHPHPAFGSQGDDKTHSHKHAHKGEGDHNHAHDTQAAADPAAATTEEGTSGMGYEFTTQQMAAIRARLGKKEGEEVSATDIAAVFGSPVPPFPVQAAAAGTSGDGPVDVPVIADGIHLVEANILRKYQEDALAGQRAVRAMHVAERDQILAAAIREGKFAQAQLDHFKSLWDRDPDGTRKLVASLAGGLVPTGGPMGSNGDWATDPDMPGDFDSQSAYRALYPEDSKGGIAPAPGVRTR